MTLITLEEVQRATSRCLLAHPVRDNVLPKESKHLASLLGVMFFRRLGSIDDGELSAEARQSLRDWSPAPATRAVSNGSMLATGDA